MEQIEIYTEYIKLDQFLKLAGIICNGSDAKIIIANAEIKVNGEIETRRGKKLRNGDIVEYNKKSIQILQSNILEAK